MHKPHIITGVLAALATLALGHPVAANVHTGSAAATMSSGYDVSWPQCSSNLPGDGTFGIVGVSNGRPWGANPCLAAEYSWAAARPGAPGLYMNTANPAPHSSFYWPASGAHDPALCTNSTSTTDPGCAYDYGWHAARDSLSAATSITSTSTQLTWWLDVETGNTWNGDGSSNAADLQGSIDYLRSAGVPKVGIYSTASQWTAITGGYTTASQSSYAASWRGEFATPNGISSSPDWIAGAASAGEATNNCATSFTGGATELAQYSSGGFDADVACAGSTPPPNPDYSLAAAPSAVTAARGARATSTITVSQSGGWTGSVSLTATSAQSGVSVALSPTGAVAPGASSTLTLSANAAGKYSVTVTATPASGSSSSTRHSTVVTFTVTTRRH